MSKQLKVLCVLDSCQVGKASQTTVKPLSSALKPRLTIFVQGLKKESYTTTQQTTQSKHIMTAGSTVCTCCNSHSVCSTHSDGDRAGHRSEVSLDEFGSWSRLKRQNQRHYHMKLLLTYAMNGTDLLTLEALRLQ